MRNLTAIWQPKIDASGLHKEPAGCELTCLRAAREPAVIAKCYANFSAGAQAFRHGLRGRHK